MEKKIEAYRQGDVVLMKINELPKGLKEKDNVLALGEATGHSHKLIDGKTFIGENNQQYVLLEQETELIHDEHAQQTIPKGVYQVNIKREVNLLNEVRQVMD